MKKVLFTAVLLLIGVMVFAQQPVVAVAPFDIIGNAVTEAQASEINDVFFVRLGNTRRVGLVNRSIVDRILREHQFQAGDWSNDNKTAELARALNADWIVQGNIRRSGDNLLIIIQFYDIKTFRFEGGTDLRLANADEAYDRMDTLVNSLIETISGSVATSTTTTAQPAAPPVQPVPNNMVRIEGGTFTMGSPSSESGRSDNEVQHRVTVSSFYMGKYQVTQEEYETVMGTNPSNKKGYNLPVEQVTWYEAVEYCNRLSQREGLTPAYTINGTNVSWNRSATGYRLPTEAEWEYAARGGNGSPGNFIYSGSNSIDEVAWYTSNSAGGTQPVGTKKANGLGLYDLSGNVWEWCWDWYGAYPTSLQADPVGASSGSFRVGRGGSWYNTAQNVRSAYRNYGTPSNRNNILGFRLVRPVQ
jgi:formylglycine-generating enzyme required for sulfatase activity